MSSSVYLTALGLQTSPNEINQQDGSLKQANNVIIRRDNVIEPRRGLKSFGTPIGTSSDRAKQLFVYKERILRHFNNTLEFQNGTTNSGASNFTAFNGSYSEVESGLRIKGIEANSNFYFTTSDGIKKISANTSSDLTSDSGYVVNSGAVKALDIDPELEITLGSSSGFLPQDSAVTYRVAWGYKDLNENLILGTPSEQDTVANPILSLMLTDFNRLLVGIDKASTGSLGYNYLISQITGSLSYLQDLGVNSSTSTDTLRSNAIGLASRIDNDIQYVGLNISTVSRTANVVTITFANGVATDHFTIGDSIFISQFGTIAGTAINGNVPVTGVTANTITYTNVGANGSTTSIGYIRNVTTNTMPCPYSIDTVVSSSDLVTITFKNALIGANDTSNYLQTGDQIDLAGFGTVNGVSINGIRTITGLTTTTVSFIVTGSGTSSTTTLGTVNSGKYQSITQPLALSVIPNAQELLSIQTYIDEILNLLKLEPTGVISVTSMTFITPITLTTSANVRVYITVPEEVNTNYLYQVYRSETVTATGTDVLSDLTPSDELQLVFEGFVSQSEIDDGLVSFLDITPPEFRGANLYTNANSGEGITQSNDQPPLATDLALFKGYTFFSNTKTRHRKLLDLLGVTKLSGKTGEAVGFDTISITSLDHGLSTGDVVYIQGCKQNDTLNGYHVVTVTNSFQFTVSATGLVNITFITWSKSVLEISNNDGVFNLYPFVTATARSTNIAIPIAVLDGSYFTLSSTNNIRRYAVWFDDTGSTTDPTPSGYISVRINISTFTTANEISAAVTSALSIYINDFFCQDGSGSVNITNSEAGFSDPVTLVQSAFIMSDTVFTIGAGQQLVEQIQTVTCVPDVAGSLAGTAFTLYAPFSREAYYLWFKVAGTGSNPAPAGMTGIQVDIQTNDTAADIAIAISDAINAQLSGEFSATYSGDDVVISNIGIGNARFCNNLTGFSPGFSFVVNQLGVLTVEKSSQISPSISTDETARSLIEAINKNKLETVYGYYISSVEDVAGKMLLESRTLSVSETPFYVNAGDSVTGSTFSPDISAELAITSITTADPAVITAANHGFKNGQSVLITGSNSVPSIDGVWTVKNTTTNTFTIETQVNEAGTVGYLTLAVNSEFSDNEDRGNRIYYSKYQQPEAVPIVNYIDIGAKDQEISRIFALRDSLFVFKGDGIYRLSGEVAPFNVTLFDGSATLLAPDSLAILENSIFGWERGGIVQITESGVSPISRAIDNLILPTSANVYPGFKSSTFGVAYDSDQSYTVWTVKNKTDTYATVAYRYHTLTQTWTTNDLASTCGIISPVDDLMYLGSGIENTLRQERKDFDRTDYADREYSALVTPASYSKANKTLKLNTVTDYSVGDVLTQNVTITIYAFNQLLKKLDLDTGPTDNDYFSTLQAVANNNMRTKIVALAQKLDADPNVVSTDYASTIATKSGIVSNTTGITESSPVVITSTAHGLLTGRIINISGSDSSPSLNGRHVVTVLDANTFTIPVDVLTVGTSGSLSWITLDNDFSDVTTCYNAIINKLNADSGVSFSNYQTVDNATLLEAVILNVNRVTKVLTLNYALDFVEGPITIFESIDTTVEYSPITMQDPLGWKHLRESTVMFENRAFTRATLSFATDLLPEFIPVQFDSDGNGAFGYGTFGSGFFGGNSHAAPFRTYVPRQCQRCRFMRLRYEHSVAREVYKINGITLTGSIGQSERAYRS